MRNEPEIAKAALEQGYIDVVEIPVAFREDEEVIRTALEYHNPMSLLASFHMLLNIFSTI